MKEVVQLFLWHKKVLDLLFDLMEHALPMMLFAH